MSSDSSSVDPSGQSNRPSDRSAGWSKRSPRLTKQDLRPEEFYTGFLQRVVEALAAVGGAVWMLAEGNQFQLAYQINLRPFDARRTGRASGTARPAAWARWYRAKRGCWYRPIRAVATRARAPIRPRCCWCSPR